MMTKDVSTFELDVSWTIPTSVGHIHSCVHRGVHQSGQCMIHRSCGWFWIMCDVEPIHISVRALLNDIWFVLVPQIKLTKELMPSVSPVVWYHCCHFWRFLFSSVSFDEFVRIFIGLQNRVRVFFHCYEFVNRNNLSGSIKESGYQTSFVGQWTEAVNVKILTRARYYLW